MEAADRERELEEERKNPGGMLSSLLELTTIRYLWGKKPPVEEKEPETEVEEEPELEAEVSPMKPHGNPVALVKEK